MRFRLREAASLAGAGLLFFASTVHAQCQGCPAGDLLDTVQTVAAATQAVPLEFSLSISNKGTYQITLTDLGAQLTPPAPLVSVELAITSGTAIVGTPLTAPGTTTFNATQGTYVIHVVGTPGNGAGSGAVGVTVADSNDNPIDSFSGTLALPATTIPNNEGVLQGSFTVPTSASYQVTLADLQFPASLNTLLLAITVQGGALVTSLPAAGTTTVSLQSGVTYDIFAVGQSTSTPAAGLYGVNVSPAAGGTAVYANATPVGAVALLASPALTAGSYKLSIADLSLPAKLAQAGAVVAFNGQAVAQLSAAGTAAFVASTNTYGVFGLGVPAGAGAGSYSVTLQPTSGPAALSVARAVSASGGSVSTYSFDTSVPTSGTYTFDTSDFDYPAQFTAVSIAAVQFGALLGSKLNTPGSINITPAAGPVTLLVFAQPGAGGGLFGINLIASGANSAAFETTQGVGQLFSVQQLSIPTAGSYQVTVGDVGFPAPFENLGVIVSQGSTKVGEIFVSGSFNFQATSGNYEFSFVAQPDPNSSADAGTYSLVVASAPAPPTVSLQSTAGSVSSGGTVQLVWSSTNATACTAGATPASGGWSGNEPTSGETTPAPITATTTYTLTCTGAGGSKAQSMTVAVTASSGGGGGGGAIDLELLALIASAALLRGATLMRLRRTAAAARAHTH